MQILKRENFLKAGFVLVLLTLVPQNMGAQVPYAHTYTMSEELDGKLARNISLDLRKIDVVDVLKFLSTKAELNIVASQNVNGKVTLFLKEVTIMNALDIILLSTGLAIREKEGVLYVMTEEEYTALYGESYRDQRHIKIIQVKYTDPEKVSQIVEGIKSAVGKVIVDKQTGTVVLIDTADKIEMMERTIEKVDIPTVERILPTETEVFELSYGKAASLEAQAKLLLTPNVGMVYSDEKTNRLVVTDFPHALKRVRTLIHAFDRKTREVYIETKMIQVRLSDEYEMGIDWEGIINEGQGRNNYQTDLSGTFGISDSTSRFGRAVIGNLGRDDIQATLDFVHQFGDTKTLASPQITVESGKEASIVVGTREAYVTSTVSQADATTTTSESITFVDVGVQLKVTPEINQEGYVSMKISPEVSSVGRTLTTSNGNEVPIVDTTNASTQVTVKDGRTVLIGGLMKEEVSKTVSKVPVLGEIPWLGTFFRYTTDSTTKTELVIFLTPHIVEGDELGPLSYTPSSKAFEKPRDLDRLKQELETKIARLKKTSAAKAS